jgi:hypothetical protein
MQDFFIEDDIEKYSTVPSVQFNQKLSRLTISYGHFVLLGKFMRCHLSNFFFGFLTVFNDAI